MSFGKLTDYERYQLEWMIEHGHSLKEFVQGLALVDLDGIGSLWDAYVIWENDYGFGGEVFSNEEEYAAEDSPAPTATESESVSLVAGALAEAIRRGGGEPLRDWYEKTYPEDPLGSKINPAITFDDALSAVPTGGGFYDSIGVADSMVRECVFEELCNRYGYSYDEVYDSWLHKSPLPEREGREAARTDGLDLEAEARDMRGVADGISTRQPEATGRAERGC